MENENKLSLMQMARGAISERVDYEVDRIISNILDPNTDPVAKRKVQLTVEFAPDEERTGVKIKATAKATLAPAVPIATTLVIASDRNGEMVLAEMQRQLPGQVDMEGHVQEAPKITKFKQA